MEAKRAIVMTPRPAPHIVRWFLRTFGYGGITPPPLGIYILAEHNPDTKG